MKKLIHKHDSIAKFLLALIAVAVLMIMASSTGNFVGENLNSAASNLGVKTLHFSDGFETGTFGPFTHQGDAGWTVVYDSNLGTYYARSGAITHNQQSILVLYIELPKSAVISFSRRVSSETGYDSLGFYRTVPVANIQVGSGEVEYDDVKVSTPPFNSDFILMDTPWSGDQRWTRVSYVLPPGKNTLYWVYYKDSSNSEEEDGAMIDDIKIETLP